MLKSWSAYNSKPFLKTLAIQEYERDILVRIPKSFRNCVYQSLTRYESRNAHSVHTHVHVDMTRCRNRRHPCTRGHARFRNRRHPCPRGHACSRFPQIPMSLGTCPFPEPQAPMSTWTRLLALPADTHVPGDMPVSGTAGTHVHGDTPVRASRRYPCPQVHAPLRFRKKVGETVQVLCNQRDVISTKSLFVFRQKPAIGADR